MAQHDQVLANGPGVAVRSDLNAALAAAFSSSSGNTEPAVKVAGQLWFDTSVAGVSTLKIRDQTNSNWIVIPSDGNVGLMSALVVQPASGTFPVIYMVKSASGLGCNIYGRVGTANRWILQLGNGTAEAGSNAGSDLTIIPYSDNGLTNLGGSLGAAVLLTRANGKMSLGYDFPAKPTAGGFSATSDARIKDDIEDYQPGLAEVVQLRPVTYRFKPETGNDPNVLRYGLVAQEAEQAMPDLVTREPGRLGEFEFDDMRTFNPTNITYALINAVKELAARVTELEAQLATTGAK